MCAKIPLYSIVDAEAGDCRSKQIEGTLVENARLHVGGILAVMQMYSPC